MTIETLAQRYVSSKPDKVAGIESRGFIIGAALGGRQRLEAKGYRCYALCAFAGE